MSERGWRMPPRPGRIASALLRAPVWLYRLGLGRLLGRRFLLLRHRGRLTGVAHDTVLEVIERDGDTAFVVSGFGREAHWLQNLQMGPPLLVETGGRRFVPAARFLDRHEAARRLAGYARRYPRAAAALARRLYGGSFDPERMAAATEVLALEPRPAREDAVPPRRTRPSDPAR